MLPFLAYLGLFAGAGTATAISPPNRLVAYTQQNEVHGVEISPLVDGFLGVPYSQPPLGDLRFELPQPLPVADTADRLPRLNATKFGPVCYQFNYRTVVGNLQLPTSGESEDCLTLNIFSPRRRNKNRLLPVYIWSFGGGFGEGGGSIPLYDPTAFVELNSNIIVVTWNYRLNLFGFPNTPALRAQNLGIRDQRAALEWLRDNVAAFGGDPDHMVFGGQSAGADTGHAMLYSHQEDPIIKGLILQSGTVQVINAAVGAGVDAEFVRVARTVGCADPDDRDAELRCMRSIDATRLKHAVSNETFNLFGSPPGGSPMVDNATIFTLDEYSRRGKAGDFAHIPILIGNTDNEGDSVLNWSETGGVHKNVSDIITTTLFNCNIALESGFRALHGIPVWRYRYMGVFPSVTPYSWLRSYHTADIPFVLGTYGIREAPLPYEVQAARLIQRVFSAFIRSPRAGLRKEFGWPVFDPQRRTLVELFRDNQPRAAFVHPHQYDEICTNPPQIPWEDIFLPPPL